MNKLKLFVFPILVTLGTLSITNCGEKTEQPNLSPVTNLGDEEKPAFVDLAEISVENITNIFSWYPEFLGTSTAKWAYSTGINSKPLTINAYAKGNKYNLSFGENTSQIVYFTPAKSGTYSFLIDNAYAYTFASLYDENLNLQKTKKTNDITYIDKWTNKIKIAQNNCLTLNSYLTANKKYKIVIYRKNDSNVRLFGTSNIEILMVNGSINSISSSATFKRNTKVISGNESNLLSFVPSMTDIYTFVATDEYSGVLDTYLEVRDKNQQIIYKSDNGAGSSRAFVALTLAKGIRYYIVSRNKTSSHTSYKIYTFAEDYLPYISGSNRNASIRMNFNGIKHYYYLVHYNRAYNGNLILEFLYTNITRTPIKVELTDYKGTLKYNYSISDSNYNSFSVSSNTFYVLHVFTNSSSSNEYINFCLS